MRLHTVIGSTRPGRIGAKIGQWFHGVATERATFDARLVDLAEVALPLYDEPRHPRLRQYEHAHTRAWSESVAAADAFVFVTPEYNHSPAPSVLNAFDYVYSEWNYKPIAFVTYGGISGGLRALQVQRLTAVALKMVPIIEAVNLMNVSQVFDAAGNFVAREPDRAAAVVVLDELLRWAKALKPMRAPAT